MRETRYRKKPVVIEAVRLPRDENGERDFMAWGHVVGWLGPGDWKITDDLGVDIPTLEGTMHAAPGDWIIRGVKGELYPCKPDIFALTYESVATPTPEERPDGQ